MFRKVDSAVAAIQAGVEKVSFVDGRVPHAVLLEIFTDEGVGTEVVLQAPGVGIAPGPPTGSKCREAMNVSMHSIDRRASPGGLPTPAGPFCLPMKWL